ncbi:MAG: hypothetical protein AVDCRST_MAG23-808, partial [uncultured Sphingosinicella sp.]
EERRLHLGRAAGGAHHLLPAFGGRRHPALVQRPRAGRGRRAADPAGGDPAGGSFADQRSRPGRAASIARRSGSAARGDDRRERAGEPCRAFAGAARLGESGRRRAAFAAEGRVSLGRRAAGAHRLPLRRRQPRNAIGGGGDRGARAPASLPGPARRVARPLGSDSADAAADGGRDGHGHRGERVDPPALPGWNRNL